MTCDEVRVALSAWLDGEDPGVPVSSLGAHTNSCPACGDWLTGVQRVSSALRLDRDQASELAPDVLAGVAAGARARAVTGRPASAAHGRRQVLRVAVGAAAVAQFASSLPTLLAGLGVTGGPHLGRELASCGMALAVGFGLAAYRPERAQAFIPIALTLAVLMVATSVVDIANSTTVPAREIGHLATVVQAGLLWALGRAAGTSGPPLPTIMAAGRG